MNQEEISAFIGQIELFRTLDRDALNHLAAHMKFRKIRSKTYIFKENTPRKNLFIIFSGEIELIKSSPFGEEKRLAVFSRYDFLGEGALMDDYPHSTSARALKNTELIQISRDAINEMFRAHSALAAQILSGVARVISRRMRQASTRVVNVAAQYISGRSRIEHDLLGEREVPYEYYYGIQTLRALENFNISGISLTQFPDLIEALAMVKMAAAMTNMELGHLDKNIGAAITDACKEILNGRHHTQFVVDLIQGGAGTSTNMNANEVIANRALELMGYDRGMYEYCHPNNHVNLSQSTNDVYPTALKLALYNSNKKLLEVLKELIAAMRKKSTEFKHVIKMGRTQLQDAVPMTLGQEFNAYAVTLQEEVDRLQQNVNLFLEVNLGGTAIGTGINADPAYRKKVVQNLRRVTGIKVIPAADLVEATQDTGAFVMYSSALKRLALKLSKISNDLRLLSSGPRAGFNEINLPKMQPGSSIMPGKVNPVIPEVINQIAFKVVGNDLTVTMAVEAGQLELNVMEPVIGESLFQSIEMLKNGMKTFTYRCIHGISANEEKCRSYVQNSIGLVTALNPILGYETCTQLAKEALATNRGVYELVIEKKLLSPEELDRMLDPRKMIQ